MSRSLTPAALAVGALYAVLGALELALGQEPVFDSPGDYVIEWVFVLALGLAVAVLIRLARGSSDRITAVGFAGAAAGHAAMGVAAVATAVAGRESLDLLFPVGVLVTLVSLAVLAVQDLRKRVSPPHAGLVLAAAFVLSIPAEGLFGAGSLVLAAGWLGLSRLLGATREPVAA